MNQPDSTSAARVCAPGQHDLEQVFSHDSDLTGVLCLDCGKSWRVAPAPAEQVVGYVVVATRGDRPETVKWMTPTRRNSIAAAELDLDFWRGGKHLRDAELRLAKLVLLDEEGQADRSAAVV